MNDTSRMIATMEQGSGRKWPHYVRCPDDKNMIYGVYETNFQELKAWHEDRGETVDEVFK